jgi:hypothetical protein
MEVKSKLLDQMWQILRLKHMSIRTEESYVNRVKPTFKEYWQIAMIFRFDIVLTATQTSSLGQKRLS